MTTWHVAGAQLTAYLEGRLDPPRVMSVEAHLARCGPCRARIPVDEQWLAASWDAVLDQVARPRRSAAERLLAAFGVPAHVARLVGATPALSRAWLAAMVLVLAFALVATHLSDGDPVVLLVFLVVAPVLPLAGIALAYGPVVDPAHEVVAATPLGGGRVLLVRASSVLLGAILLTAATAPVLPGPLGLTASWLLPGLALALACLTAGTRFPVRVAAVVLGALWLVAVLATQGVDRFLFFHPAAQLGYAAAVAILGSVLYARRRRLDPGEPQWV